MDIRNKKIVVVGLGESGLEAALLAHRNIAIVSVTDSSPKEKIIDKITPLTKEFIDVETGSHTEEFLRGADIIVLSPGVDNESLPVKYALRQNIPMISEIEFAYNFCKGKIIAVSGTNGKSTVVKLLGKMFEVAGKEHVVCGNIGNSFSGEINNIKKGTFVILEVSSFQLEHIIDLKPFISCLLNISDDHLDRYSKAKDYADTKMRIFENQDQNDISLVNKDDPFLKNVQIPGKGKRFFFSIKDEVDGAYMIGNVLYTKFKDNVKKQFSLEHNPLKGEYNLQNICAASFMAFSSGIEAEHVLKAIKDFVPLRHRMEKFYEKSGVTYIDDSKATNIDAVKRALESLDRPVVLIAGGVDKGGDYKKIRTVIKKKTKALIVLGEAANKIESAFLDTGIVIKKVNSMEKAVFQARSFADKDDVVLLSPMCSSFDMYESYKHRGEDFQRIVKEF